MHSILTISTITRDLTGHKLYSPWAACLLIFSSNCGIYFPFLYIYVNINQFSARDTTTHHLFSQQYMLCVEGGIIELVQTTEHRMVS